MFGDPRPETALSLLLGKKCIGSDEPVGVASFTVFKRNGVHHAVTVEGVIALDGLE
jgi:hypothetical protein